MGREIAVLDHEEPSGRCSFGPQKDVHRHLIRTLGKQIPAHVPWRRMHGLDANGFRYETRPPKQACRASRNWRPQAPLRIRVVAVRSSRDAFPWILRYRDTFVSSFSFRLRSRALRGPPNGYAILSSSNRAIWRSKADGSPIALELLRRVRSLGFSPVRRSWRRSWRPWRRSWRWVRRPCRRCIPCVPVASAGAAVVRAASCASASNGSNADDRVKPNAAPSPSSEIAFVARPFPFGFFRSLAVSLSLTIAELEWRQLNAITSMLRRRKFGRIDRGGRRPPGIEI